MTEAVVAQRNTVSAEGFVNPLTLAANAEEASHVKVYGDDVLLTLGVDYTLDGEGDIGDLDAIDGVEATIDEDVLLADLYDTFTIEHDPPADQDSDLTSGGTLGRLYMGGLDAIMRRVQSIKQLFVDRALTLPVDAVDVDVTLPLPVDRRGLVWELDQDTGDYRIVNSYSDPDTEPLTSAVEAQVAAEQAEANAEAAAAVAQAQALAAADSADRAEDAAAEAGDLTALLAFLWPVGAKLEHFGFTAPANFLACDGALVSRATYSALWAVLHREATVTISIATPAVISWTAHGLVAGDFVRFYTTGALPTGLTANTTYWVIAAGLTADAFRVSATEGGAAINTSGGQSGVHTLFHSPYGNGDGTTTFKLPTWNDGRFTRATGGTAAAQGVLQTEMIGPHDHDLTIDSGGAHTHTYGPITGAYGANRQSYGQFRPSMGDSDWSSATITTSSNGSHTHTGDVAQNSGTENRPANSSVLVCIKY